MLYLKMYVSENIAGLFIFIQEIWIKQGLCKGKSKKNCYNTCFITYNTALHLYLQVYIITLNVHDVRYVSVGG